MISDNERLLVYTDRWQDEGIYTLRVYGYIENYEDNN